MDRTGEFIEVYKQIEQIANERYNINPEKDNYKSSMHELQYDPEFASLRYDINLCRKVRNIYSHYPRQREKELIYVSEETLRMLKNILKTLCFPVTVDSLMIKEIYSKKLADKVYEAMKDMRSKTYTHIPILKNKVVQGVFSENTIFSYLIDEEIMEISEDMTFEDFEKYLPIDKHDSETFIFVPLGMTASELNKKFEEAVKRQERIGMVFVTANGGQTEKLLGIITPWDMIGK